MFRICTCHRFCIGVQLNTRLENRVGRGENDIYKDFLLDPRKFSKVCSLWYGIT